MNEKQEIILNKDGSTVLRTTSETPLSVVDKLVEGLGENTVRTVKRAGTIDKLPYAIIKSAKELYAVMALPELTLTAPWGLDKDGLMRPKFNDNTGDSPSIPLRWPAAPGMVIVFAARIYDNGGCYATKAKDSCYLLAMDALWRSYLLPLPNLYATGYVCMGDFSGADFTLQGAFEKAYRQLQQSKWNADLFDGEKPARANKLLTFKPEGDQFTPQPYKAWDSLLDRCEGPVIELLKGGLR